MFFIVKELSGPPWVGLLFDIIIILTCIYNIVEFHNNRSIPTNPDHGQYLNKEDYDKLIYDTGIFDNFSKMNDSTTHDKFQEYVKINLEKLINLTANKLKELNPQFSELLESKKSVIRDIIFEDGIIDSFCNPHDRYRTGDQFSSVRRDCEKTIESIEEMFSAIVEIELERN